MYISSIAVETLRSISKVTLTMTLTMHIFYHTNFGLRKMFNNIFVSVTSKKGTLLYIPGIIALFLGPVA